SGPMLDGYLPNSKVRFPSSIAITTLASAVAAVDSLKAQGVDFIKVQSVISHDAYLAAAAEAHKQGLPIVGHVPDKVRIEEVVEAGQKSIEHLMGIFEGCSTEEDKIHQRRRQSEAPAHDPRLGEMQRAYQTACGEPDMAGAHAGLAARRNVSRSARPEASTAG